MLLFPKKFKYKTSHRGRLTGKKNIIFKDSNNSSTQLQSVEPIWLTAIQIEAARKIISKNIKKIGKLIIRVFPDKPVSKKSKESRMGSGKGTLDHWVAVVKTGAILFELLDIPEIQASKIFKKIQYKLPVKTKILINK